MHAVIVETLPPLTPCSASESFEIELAFIGEYIVLARHVVNLTCARTFQDLRGSVELRGLRQMRDIAGMNHKRGLFFECVDLVDSLLQRLRNFVIRISVKADVTVADLNKAEAKFPLWRCQQLEI